MIWMEGIGTQIKKKLTHDEKHFKKTLELEKHTIFGRLGEVSARSTKKSTKKKL